MFKISNVYKALLILPEECKHPNLVLNLSSTKFSTKSKFSTIDSTKFSTAVYTTPFGACVRALWKWAMTAKPIQVVQKQVGARLHSCWEDSVGIC